MAKFEFHSSSSLKDAVNNLPDDDSLVICQTVGADGSAWNMFGAIYTADDTCNINLVQLSHPDIVTVNVDMLSSKQTSTDIHYAMLCKLNEEVSKHKHLTCEVVQEIPEVKRLYDAINVFEELFINNTES